MTLDFKAARDRLSFDARSRFDIEIRYEDDAGVPVDLSGFGVRMTLRSGTTGAKLVVFSKIAGSITTPTPVGEEDPNIVVSVLATDTEFFDFYGPWDLYLDPSGIEDESSAKLIGGPWDMTPASTVQP